MTIALARLPPSISDWSIDDSAPSITTAAAPALRTVNRFAFNRAVARMAVPSDRSAIDERFVSAASVSASPAPATITSSAACCALLRGRAGSDAIHATPSSDVPRSVTGGNGVAQWMVHRPFDGADAGRKRIAFGPAIAFALRMNCRNEPWLLL